MAPPSHVLLCGHVYAFSICNQLQGVQKLKSNHNSKITAKSCHEEYWDSNILFLLLDSSCNIFFDMVIRKLAIYSIYIAD